MYRRSWSIVAIIVVAAMAISAIDATPVLAKRPDSRIPVEYRQLYNALEMDMDEFEATIDSSWDGSTYPVAFSAALSNANSNVGEALLNEQNWANILTLLDLLDGLGVTGISPFHKKTVKNRCLSATHPVNSIVEAASRRFLITRQDAASTLPGQIHNPAS